MPEGLDPRRFNPFGYCSGARSRERYPRLAVRRVRLVAARRGNFAGDLAPRAAVLFAAGFLVAVACFFAAGFLAAGFLELPFGFAAAARDRFVPDLLVFAVVPVLAAVFFRRYYSGLH